MEYDLLLVPPRGAPSCTLCSTHARLHEETVRSGWPCQPSPTGALTSQPSVPRWAQHGEPARGVVPPRIVAQSTDETAAVQRDPAAPSACTTHEHAWCCAKRQARRRDGLVAGVLVACYRCRAPSAAIQWSGQVGDGAVHLMGRGGLSAEENESRVLFEAEGGGAVLLGNVARSELE